MPRRRPDTVFEHRISLSDFERQRIDEVITTAQANVAVDGLTATLTAVSGIGLAGAALLGSFVFMKWKGPTILVDLFTKVTETTSPVLDTITDFILPSNPVELRREAQRLAKVRGEIAKAEANFCAFSSGNYSEAQCSNVQAYKDQYFIELEALRTQVRDATVGAAKVSYGGLVGDALATFIFAGLGDIDPNYGTGSSAFTAEQRAYYRTLTAQEKAIWIQGDRIVP